MGDEARFIRIEAQLHRVEKSLESIIQYLSTLERAVLQEKEGIMSAMDDLIAQAKVNTDAEAAAVQVIQSIATQLAAAQSDPAKIQALTAQLKASATALGAAIVANTPAAPAPTPATPPTTPTTPATP